ncbi:hypothetical protein HG530_013807 [Fusarium avenaceum]|nr:hypothetical protein HG530_013807 [Fusarium avenaceum]
MDFHAVATSINNIPGCLSEVGNLLPNLFLSQSFRGYVLALQLDSTARGVFEPTTLEIVRITCSAEIPKLLKHVAAFGMDCFEDFLPTRNLFGGGDAWAIHECLEIELAQNPSKVNGVGTDARRVAHGELSTAELNAILVVVSLTDNVLDIRRRDIRNVNAEADEIKFRNVVIESGELREGDSDRLLAVVVQVVDHDVGVGSGSLASGGLGCGSRAKDCDGAGDDG